MRERIIHFPSGCQSLQSLRRKFPTPCDVPCPTLSETIERSILDDLLEQSPDLSTTRAAGRRRGSRLRDIDHAHARSVEQPDRLTQANPLQDVANVEADLRQVALQRSHLRSRRQRGGDEVTGLVAHQRLENELQRAREVARRRRSEPALADLAGRRVLRGQRGLCEQGATNGDARGASADGNLAGAREIEPATDGVLPGPVLCSSTPSGCQSQPAKRRTSWIISSTEKRSA